jgi:hypothetical protein
LLLSVEEEEDDCLKFRSYKPLFLPSFTLNSEAATSKPTLHFLSCPASRIASMTSSSPDLSSQGGAKPPSSPIKVASPPYFDLITFFFNIYILSNKEKCNQTPKERMRQL